MKSGNRCSFAAIGEFASMPGMTAGGRRLPVRVAHGAVMYYR
jgi:hypothetical protein